MELSQVKYEKSNTLNILADLGIIPEAETEKIEPLKDESSLKVKLLSLATAPKPQSKPEGAFICPKCPQSFKTKYDL